MIAGDELRESYERIAGDRVPVPDLSPRERDYVKARLDGPSDAYMELVVLLDRDGCQFPRVQAALMMCNTPGVAKRLLQGSAS